MSQISLHNVLLIDVDSNIPNLALCKIKAHHEARGDNVGFNIPNPDIVYCSIIFTENRHMADGLPFFYPNAIIHVGGSGYDLNIKLPEHIEYLKPDYSLYDGLICQKCSKKVNRCRCFGKAQPGNIYYSLGFTSRGCFRNCGFCIVRDKEGFYQRWQHPKEFHDPGFDRVKLLDNNIYYDKEWFFEVSDWFIEHNLIMDSEGMDLRIIDLEIAKRLKEIRWWRSGPTFAFDMTKHEKKIREGAAILAEAGIKQAMIYIYCHDEAAIPDAIHRWEVARELGFDPFLMVNKDNLTPRLRTIRRRGSLPAVWRNMTAQEVFAA